MTENRIDVCFQKLKQNKTTAYIPFITAGYPNYQKSLEILLSLPENGGDIIELGMPFSDPIADGPVIQKAAHEAFKICARLEGIIPALEPAHAIAFVMKIAPQMNGNQNIIMNLCGRGDKDINTIQQYTKKQRSNERQK